MGPMDRVASWMVTEFIFPEDFASGAGIYKWGVSKTFSMQKFR